MTSLWRIDADNLVAINPSALDTERNLEDWIERNPSMLDQDLLIIGRQVKTDHGGVIDLLGVDSTGAIAVIELKKDKTPREIVPQVLDYASWVSGLKTPDISRIAEQYLKGRNAGRNLPDAFREKFGQSIPDVLNTSHSMVIVASALDPSSKRIVEYLSQVHDVLINTAFFTVFSDGERRYLSADWLMDQEEVVVRSENRVRPPWTGYWYVNVGDGEFRAWKDLQKYGFIAAGDGRKWSDQLERLKEGGSIYAYQAGRGYVGYGVVVGPKVPASEFRVNGKPLFELPLAQPNLKHDADNPDRAEYAVPVSWNKTYSLEEAKTFPGIFATPLIACRLRDQRTLDYLKPQFEDAGDGPHS
jgi:hypothetical protein